jgi:hypothetical protein
MLRTQHSHSLARRGITLVETAVAAAAVAAVAVTAVPVFRKVGCNAMRAQSATQMASLSAAHASYAADFNDRQFTMCPDNLGQYGGNFSSYQQVNGCVEPAVFGTNAAGQTYVAGPGCPSDTTGGGAFLTAFQFTTNPGIGAFRLQNVRQFNQYVGGRFLDQAFYAPDDPGVNRRVQRNIDAGSDFEVDGYAYSTYDYSPAAMFHPSVMGDGSSASSPIFRPPNATTTAGGFGHQSPTNAQCVHPSLKTRMLERHAMENSPGVNPSIAGGTTPYAWNQSMRSRSLALFFDGSVRVFTTQEAMDAEERAGGAKLWMRSTPVGGFGYNGTFAHDFLVKTSVHYLTTFGIKGRDTLAQP